MNYSTVIAQTGAAVLQVATLMTAASVGWPAEGPTEVRLLSWSDRSVQPRFKLAALTKVPVTEAQSATLHRALLASFDNFAAPILIS